MLDSTIFSRYLDLAPLKSKRSGCVLCIFHRERTPSFSVDLDAGVFHCFGCGVEGGILDFSQLIIRQGFARAEDIALRQQWAKPEVQALSEVQERIKAARRDIMRLREAADDSPSGWAMLSAAADLETITNAAEAETDDVMGW